MFNWLRVYVRNQKLKLQKRTDSRLPWPFYRLYVTWRIWRNLGPHMNRVTRVEARLREAVKRDFNLPPEECRELADLLSQWK